MGCCETSHRSGEYSQRSGEDLVFVWDLAAGKLLRSFPIQPLGEEHSLATDPTGKTMCVGGNNTRELRFYGIATGQK